MPHIPSRPLHHVCGRIQTGGETTQGRPNLTQSNLPYPVSDRGGCVGMKGASVVFLGLIVPVTGHPSG